MKKSPLSISNFNLKIKTIPVTIKAFLGTVLLIIMVEIILTQFLKTTLVGWDYWSPSAAAKFVTYFENEEKGILPKLLVIGDSSGDHGFSPMDFSHSLGCDNCAFNLATLGNFPLSFEKTTNKLLLQTSEHFPDYVIIIMTRGGFNKRLTLRDTEKSILNSPIIKRLEGSRIAGDFLSICKLWPAKSQLLNKLKGRAPINRKAGFYARNSQTSKNIKKPDSRDTLIIDPIRIGILEKTIRECQIKGISPILVHAPVHSFEKLRWINEDAYSNAAQNICTQMGIPFWDYSHNFEYDNLMADIVHLSSEGATLFSKALAEQFKNYSRKGN